MVTCQRNVFKTRFLKLFGVVFLVGSIGVLSVHAQSNAKTLKQKELANTLMQLRVQLAEMNLKIKQIQRETQSFKLYLKEANPQADIKKWEAELETIRARRAELAKERRAKMVRRAAMDKAKRAAAVAKAARNEDSTDEADESDDPSNPRYRVDYKVSLIYTGESDTIVYRTFDPLRPELAHTIIEKHPNVDRKNVHIEGSFQNTSTKPYRYTFEIRLAKQNRIIGSARYQTPMLKPNILHQFKVKVPVENVKQITAYQIGNVTADAPNQPKQEEVKGNANKPIPRQ